MPTQVLVTQLGARRHYAVARALHTHVMLQLFCTDVYVSSTGVRRALNAAGAMSGIGGFKRLAGRLATDLPRQYVADFPRFAAQAWWRGRVARSETERTRHWMWAGDRFGRLCAEKINAETDAVYAFTSTAKSLFERARDGGKLCILDQSTAPRVAEVRLIREEAERFPGWGVAPELDDATLDYDRLQRRELALSDLVICASGYVANLVGKCANPARTVVVPFGIASEKRSDKMFDRRGRPLKVLFVGNEGLRKGIGDLVSALQLLASGSVHTRIIGDLRLSRHALDEIGQRAEVLGPLPSSELEAQYRWADVFVLPSISDTFAMTILEAMSYGLPVVTTLNAGGADIVDDGRSGFIVPIRDPEALAERLDNLAADRGMLVEMGHEARRTADRYSLSRYGLALAKAIEGARFETMTKRQLEASPAC